MLSQNKFLKIMKRRKSERLKWLLTLWSVMRRT